MSNNIVLHGRRSDVATRTTDGVRHERVTDTAITAVEDLITGVGSGDISLRQARKIGEAAETVHGFTRQVSRIVHDTADIARIGATCVRDVAQLHAEVSAYKAVQAKNDADREAEDARGGKIGAVVAAELETRELTAEVKNLQLRQQLATLKAEQAKTGGSAHVAAPPPAPTRISVPSDEEATRARLTTEAEEVLRHVQTGNIPAGARFPFHAFAGCLYLRLQLDGNDASAAARMVTKELVAHMLHGGDFTAAQIREFARQHEELKKQLRAKADRTHSDQLLSSLGKIGVHRAPANGDGVR